MQRHCRSQLKEEIGRHQCKNSSNNLKSNTVTPEPSGHTTGRFDHHYREKAEENDFKCNILKMMEAFNEEIKKNFLKETEEKTNKKIEGN